MGQLGSALQPHRASLLRAAVVGLAWASVAWACADDDETRLFVPASPSLAIRPQRAVGQRTVSGRVNDAGLGAVASEQAPGARELPLPARPLVSLLEDPNLAAGLCRRAAIAQTAVDSASEVERVERCEQLSAACDAAQPAGAEFSSAVGAVLAALPDTLGDSGCVLPTERLEQCSAELLGFVVSEPGLGTCREPEPSVSVGELLGLPACVSLLPGCPQLLALLTGAL